MTQPGSIIIPGPTWFPRTQRIGIADSNYGWAETAAGHTPAAENIGGTLTATATLTGDATTVLRALYVDSNENHGATVTIPAHEVGDLIVLWVFRNNANTIPTKPAASGTVPAWVDIDANTGANSVSGRTAYFVATGTHTSGTWANATDVIAVVVRGQNGSTPIGGHSESGGSRTSGAIAPAISMSNTNGTSVLLYFYGRAAAGDWDTWSTKPTGYTRRAGGGGEYTVLNTKTDTTSDGSATNETNGSMAAGYRGATIEILD